MAVPRYVLDSITTLALRVPWNHPIVWFAHPFFAHGSGEATGFVLPAGAEVTGPLTQGADGAWRLPAAGGLGNVTGLWGSREPIRCLLDPSLGGGAVDVRLLDRPLDHAVIYASPRAGSIEPQIARAWKNGERASWTLRYQLAGPRS